MSAAGQKLAYYFTTEDKGLVLTDLFATRHESADGPIATSRSSVAPQWHGRSLRARRSPNGASAWLMSLFEKDPEGEPRVRAFVDGLQQLGWTDGHNVRISGWQCAAFS